MLSFIVCAWEFQNNALWDILQSFLFDKLQIQLNLLHSSIASYSCSVFFPASQQIRLSCHKKDMRLVHLRLNQCWKMMTRTNFMYQPTNSKIHVDLSNLCVLTSSYMYMYVVQSLFLVALWCGQGRCKLYADDVLDFIL